MSVRAFYDELAPRYHLIYADSEGETATVVKASYLAITPAHVAGLLRSAGFERVERIDGRFFQPVLVGFKPSGSA